MTTIPDLRTADEDVFDRITRREEVLESVALGQLMVGWFGKKSGKQNSSLSHLIDEGINNPRHLLASIDPECKVRSSRVNQHHPYRVLLPRS